MAGRFWSQMSSQMSGWPLAMRVMSLKPPAARRSRAACSSAPSAASPIRLAAARCGTWLTTATISSCRCGVIATISAPSRATTPATADSALCDVWVVGVSTHTAPLNIVGVGAIEPFQLAAGHRVPADEARIVDRGAERALDAADVGDRAARSLEGLFHLVVGGEHRHGDERDLGVRVESNGLDTSPGERVSDPLRRDVLAMDMPAVFTEPEGDGPADQAQSDDVGTAGHDLRLYWRDFPAGDVESASLRTSSVSSRHSPGFSWRSAIGPMRVRTSLVTG